MLLTKKFRLKKNILLGILKVGLPTVILNSIGSVMYMITNKVLGRFIIPLTQNGETKDFSIGVWAFGIYFKLQSFAFMPCFGLNQGCIPIMGYNYGSGNKQRFKKTYLMAMGIAAVFMVFVTIIFHSMPVLLLKLFSAPNNEAVLACGAETLRLCSLAFIPAAVSIITIAMFNAVGHGTKAMCLSLLRQLGLLVPIGIGLINTSLGLKGYWVAFPIAEVLSIVLFLPLIIHTVKTIFKRKEAEQASLALQEQPKDDTPFEELANNEQELVLTDKQEDTQTAVFDDVQMDVQTQAAADTQAD